VESCSECANERSASIKCWELVVSRVVLSSIELVS
jgi:hypothetical protein